MRHVLVSNCAIWPTLNPNDCNLVNQSNRSLPDQDHPHSVFTQPSKSQLNVWFHSQFSRCFLSTMFFVLFCYSCGILGLCFFSFMDQPSLILVLISLFFAQLWLWVVWSWDTRMAATNSWQGQWPTYTAPSTLNTFLSGGTTYKKYHPLDECVAPPRFLRVDNT